MLRIAVQSKGRLYDDTMNLLAEADNQPTFRLKFFTCATMIFLKVLPQV